MKIAKLVIAVLLLVLGLYLLGLSIFNWIQIQGQADLSADARSAAILHHATFYSILSAILCFAASYVARFDLSRLSGFRGGQGADPPTPPDTNRKTVDQIIESSMIGIVPIRRNGDPVRDPGTYSTRIDTDNVQFFVLLKGAAAQDPEGLDKIGAVAQHFGGSKGCQRTATETAPVGVVVGQNAEGKFVQLKPAGEGGAV